MVLHDSSDTHSRASVNIIAATARYSRLGIVATLIAAPCAAVVAWPNVGASPWLGIWLTCILGLSAGRIILHRDDYSNLDPVGAQKLRKRLRLGLGMAGLLWGSLTLVLPAGLPPDRILIIMLIMVGMVAGACTAFSGLRELPPIFCVGALMGIEVGVLRFTDPPSLPAAVAAVVYVAMMLRIAQRNGRVFRSLMRSRAENQASAKELHRSVAENELLAADVKINQGLFSEALEDLQRQDFLMEKIMQSSPVALIVCDDDMRVVHSGGRAISELLILEGSHVDELPEPLHNLHRLLENTRHLPITTELNGRQLEWRGAPMQSHALAEPLFALTGVDVSESSRLRMLQTAFVRSVNHRLRNPLAKCKGALDLLMGVNTDKQWGDLIDMGQRGVGELEEIISRINTLDALTRDEQLPNLKPIGPDTIEAIAREAFETVSQEVSMASDIIFKAEENVQLMGDENVLRAVLNELVQNAAVHCREGSVIVADIRMARTERGEERVAVSIRNDVSRDWNAMGGVPDDAAAYHGLRLGTYLCRRAVENLTGEFRLEIDGDQAVAQIRLPAATGAAEDSSTADAPQRGTSAAIRFTGEVD